jgi:HlyD family secretion protein
VEAESADIVTEVAGRIESLKVAEGQAVVRGETAAILDSSVQALSVTQMEQAVAAKEARLLELKNGSRTEQVDQAKFAVESAKAQYEDLRNGPGAEQIKTLDAQVAVAQAAVDSAIVLADYTEQSLADAEALKKSGDLSDAAHKDAVYRRDAAKAARATAMKQLESAKNQRDQVKAGASAELIAAAKARYEQAQAQLDLLANGTAATSIQAAEADLAQTRAALEQSRVILGKYILKTPCDGVVTLLSINDGEVVNAGAAIGTVSDLKNLSVRLYIPQKNLSAIGLGAELDLVATSLPGKKIPARITWISDVAEFTPRNTETTASKESTVFRFKVVVEGIDSGLKPGMSLEAEIPGAVSEQ